MFSATVVSTLRADQSLTYLIGSYLGVAKIYDQNKPKVPPFPYIVVSVDKYGVDLSTSRFNVKIDVFAYLESTSKQQANTIIDRIDYLLKGKNLSDERYSAIRFFEGDVIPVENEDIKALQYSLRYECRAVESKWINSITT